MNVVSNNNDIILTYQQKVAFDKLKSFCQNVGSRVFILSGYAGTGKTTLLRTFIKWLTDQGYTNSAEVSKAEREFLGKQFVPLASTGRAAKVICDKTGYTASTVHSWIYSFKGFNQDIGKMVETIEKNHNIDNTGQLLLDFGFTPLENQAGHTIYIVDEASMISDVTSTNPIQARFGSGKVLHDLLKYDSCGKFIFVGDNCQLPPINSRESPAMMPEYIKRTYHLPITTATLTEIVRQGQDNDIILSSEKMRQLCDNPPHVTWGKFPLKGYDHIKIVGSKIELINRYVDDVKQNGYEASTLITGSNKNCNMLSVSVRKQLGFTDTRVMVGELLLVTQNNMPTGLMNGDLVKVKSIGNRIERANLTFIDVEVEELVTKKAYRTMLIEDLLYSNNINLTQVEQKNLFIDFHNRERNKNVKQGEADYNRDLMHDTYLNALRAVYGYAITCHKSQGGEWPNVYLDIPRYLSHNPDSSTYQWVYTAMTRASDALYIADDFFID